MSVRIGLDLGGTTMGAVAVDEAGGVVAGPLERATERHRPPGEILDAVVDLVSEVEARVAEVEAVGVGIPSTLDARGGFVDCPNLPTMGGVPVQAELESRLGRQVAVDNDANCFACGEWRGGAGRGARTLCGITLGTGFGMGLIIEGVIYRGRRGSAGEICYSPYRDGLTVEDVVAGPAVVERYHQRSGGDREADADLEAKDVAQRAREGDETARQIWCEFGEALGFGLCYAANLLDPDVIVIGGSLAGAADLYEGTMKHVLQRHAYDYQALRIAAPELGAIAGAVGAAFLDCDEPAVGQ